MRWTEFFIPTLKEAPAQAETPSHRLMIRAGLIRLLFSGAYMYLPLGLKAVEKTAAVVREEMERAGALELMLPILQPADLWDRSGRLEEMSEILFRFSDRHGRGTVLGPTHEETVTKLASHEIRSYKELPLTLFQIQTKFRDEFRPRGGVLRSREFLMKDAYSFCASQDSLDKVYTRMHEAYKRIFKRCGLNAQIIEADPGDMGGDVSHEFMVPAVHGEDVIVTCTECGYTASRDWAGSPPAENKPSAGELEPMKTVDTPNAATIEEVTAFLGIEASHLVKSLVYSHKEGETLVLVKGDHEVNEAKLAKVLCRAVLADEQTIREITGASVGFAGPVSLKKDIRIIADCSVSGSVNFVTGANQDDKHLIGVNAGRDFAIHSFHDLRMVTPDDPCPKCGKDTEFIQGIEVGHIFKLGTKYSKVFEASFSDADGKLKPLIMGCYGIGINRIIASLIETSHDANGIIWRGEASPFDIIITAVNYTGSTDVKRESDSLYRALLEKGYDVLLDDRDERPGSKFSDADLLGFPLRVTVGDRGLKAGVMELTERRTNAKTEVPLEHILETIEGRDNEPSD
jgi:prolyl-tRNA synthetase